MRTRRRNPLPLCVFGLAILGASGGGTGGGGAVGGGRGAEAAMSLAPAATVRGYFAALGRNDFRTAMALTSGSAQARTGRMIGRLLEQAAAHRARVELKVRRLEVATRPAAPEAPVPVDVRFSIDVVGKKWIFRKVARRLVGTAKFLVDGDAPRPRILSIHGRLD